MNCRKVLQIEQNLAHTDREGRVSTLCPLILKALDHPQGNGDLALQVPFLWDAVFAIAVTEMSQ